jgi:Short C-terminal domain
MMNITEELERLGQLHKDGTLSDEEFAQAKNKLLNAPDENPAPAPNTTLGEAANRYVSFQMIMSVIGFIVMAILFFTVFLPLILKTQGPGPGFPH